jgi:hypothetical protein
MVALLALSAIYVAFGDTTAVTALFARLAPAVVAIVAQAVVRVGQRALHHPALVGLAGASFVALALFCVPFPVVIAVAALAGCWASTSHTPERGRRGTTRLRDRAQRLPHEHRPPPPHHRGTGHGVRGTRPCQFFAGPKISKAEPDPPKRLDELARVVELPPRRGLRALVVLSGESPVERYTADP